VLAVDFRTFIPIETQPPQTVHEVLEGIRMVAVAVCVLDAEDELAVSAARVKPVEEGGAGSADMEESGGAGSEANPGRDYVGCHVRLSRVLRDVS
jgi:hypothetical protein